MTQPQGGYKTTPTKYQCPFCERWNSLKGNNGKSSINWWVFHWSVQLWWFCWQTLSRSCKRRFQVKAADQYIDNTETIRIANNEQHLIQNIHLTQGVSTMMCLQGYSWLGSGHFKLSGGAYSHPNVSWARHSIFILTSLNIQEVHNLIPWAASSILTLFLPLWTLSLCAMPFDELLIQYWPCFYHFELSASA